MKNLHLIENIPLKLRKLLENDVVSCNLWYVSKNMAHEYNLELRLNTTSLLMPDEDSFIYYQSKRLIGGAIMRWYWENRLTEWNNAGNPKPDLSKFKIKL